MVIGMKQLHSFEQARDLVVKFEKVLDLQCIPIKTDSVLNQLCLQMLDLYEKFANPDLRTPEEDARRIYRELVGLFDLLGNIVRASTHPSFGKLRPHLDLLNGGDPLQNNRTSLLDQGNNKLFELYIAALLLQTTATDVEVDDPLCSSGDNPDVIAMIGGRRWGFACKAAHSRNPRTIFENIAKAVDQIERSPADSGFPVLTAKNIIDHDSIWPAWDGAHLSYPAMALPLGLLKKQALELRDSLVGEVGLEELRGLFREKKCQPASLVYLPSATSTLLNGKPHPTRINLLQLIEFDSIEKDAIKVVQALHDRLQAAGGA
jgi:hypothetical protein